jgi:hypothetical protein
MSWGDVVDDDDDFGSVGQPFSAIAAAAAAAVEAEEKSEYVLSGIFEILFSHSFRRRKKRKKKRKKVRRNRNLRKRKKFSFSQFLLQHHRGKKERKVMPRSLWRPKIWMPCFQNLDLPV